MNVSIVTGTYDNNMLIHIRTVTFYVQVILKNNGIYGVAICNGKVQIYIYYKCLSILVVLMYEDKKLNII